MAVQDDRRLFGVTGMSRLTPADRPLPDRVTLFGMSPIQVLLVGGPSHSGKSTLAEALAVKLGWSHVSTDSMARHPRRPWKTESRPVPEHVVAHYSSLSVGDLIADVMRHYNGMWPDIEGLVRPRVIDRDADSMVLEGSAVLPERVAAAGLKDVAACWLTANDEVLERRIHAAIGFDGATPEDKTLIQKIVSHNQRYNALITNSVKQLGLNNIDTGNTPDVDAPVRRCVDLLES